MNTLTNNGISNAPIQTSKISNESANDSRKNLGIFRDSRLAQLLVALLVGQIGLAIVLHFGSTQRTVFPTGEPLLTATAAEINQIEIGDADESLTLTKESGTWKIDGENKLPVQAKKVDQLLESLTTLKTGLPIANSVSSRKQLKVAQDDFVRKLTLSGEETEPVSLLLGTSPGLRKSHLRQVETDEIYSASLPVSDIPSKIDDWLDKSLLSYADISSVEINGIRFNASGESDTLVWSVGKPEGDGRTIDGERFKAAVSALQNLRVSGVRNANSDTDEAESAEVLDIIVAAGGTDTTLTVTKKGNIHTAKRNDISAEFMLSSAQYERLSELSDMESFFETNDDVEPSENSTEAIEISTDN